MKRKKMKKSKDKKIFKRTAERTRKANIPKVVSRGGIRL